MALQNLQKKGVSALWECRCSSALPSASATFWLCTSDRIELFLMSRCSSCVSINATTSAQASDSSSDRPGKSVAVTLQAGTPSQSGSMTNVSVLPVLIPVPSPIAETVAGLRVRHTLQKPSVSMPAPGNHTESYCSETVDITLLTGERLWITMKRARRQVGFETWAIKVGAVSAV
jgi:hypothetical protein